MNILKKRKFLIKVRWQWTQSGRCIGISRTVSHSRLRCG